MTNHLHIIQSVTEEHNAIKGNIKLLGDTVTDQEAATTLQKLRTEWIPGQFNVLATRMDKLKQALGYLDEGLTKHFVFEEQSFPQLLGENLTKALLMDHTQIKDEIDNAKKLIGKVKFDGLKREAIMAKEMEVQQVITRITNLVESHARKEETLMEMLRKALEDDNT
jgi:hemerythrin